MLFRSPAVSLKFHRPSQVWKGYITAVSAEEHVRRVAILVVLYLLPAIALLQPIVYDPDIWWHLQSGKWIVEHGTVPATDPFSIYGEGKPWVVYSWLFDVGIYGLVRLLGESGILLYTLICVWLIMLMLHRIIGSRSGSLVFTCGLMIITLLALSSLYTPRPWLLTILFFAITMDVVLLLREGKRLGWIWLLPLVYAVWANVHIQFIYGLSLLGLACLTPLIDRYFNLCVGTQVAMVERSPQWKKLVVLTLLCTLATMVTPYHVKIYSTVFELAAQTGMWEYAFEMQAPAFRTVGDWMMLLLFSLALIQLGRRASWSSFEVLLLIVSAASAFRGFRDTWFLVLSSIAVLVSKQPQDGELCYSIIPRFRFLLICILVAAGSIWLWGYREIAASSIEQNSAKHFPIKAATFVNGRQYPGPLYNHFDWGGYLMWRLPQLKVSMDGRAAVHGDERIKRALETWAGRPHWNEDPDLNNARIIIAKKNMALTSLLRLDSRFTEVYQDETTVVFVRTDHEYSQLEMLEAPAEMASVQ